MDEATKEILRGFLEESWSDFEAYLEEHGEDSGKSEEIFESLKD